MRRESNVERGVGDGVTGGECEHGEGDMVCLCASHMNTVGRWERFVQMSTSWNEQTVGMPLMVSMSFEKSVEGMISLPEMGGSDDGVEIWRGGDVAEKERELSWRGVNVTRDDEELAGLEGSEWHWRRTREAMERLGTLQSTRRGCDELLCAAVGVLGLPIADIRSSRRR